MFKRWTKVSYNRNSQWRQQFKAFSRYVFILLWYITQQLEAFTNPKFIIIVYDCWPKVKSIEIVRYCDEFWGAPENIPKRCSRALGLFHVEAVGRWTRWPLSRSEGESLLEFSFEFLLQNTIKRPPLYDFGDFFTNRRFLNYTNIEVF